MFELYYADCLRFEKMSVEILRLSMLDYNIQYCSNPIIRDSKFIQEFIRLSPANTAHAYIYLEWH